MEANCRAVPVDASMIASGTIHSNVLADYLSEEFSPRREGDVMSESFQDTPNGTTRVLVKRYEDVGIEVTYYFRMKHTTGGKTWDEVPAAREIKQLDWRSSSSPDGNRRRTMNREDYEYRNPVLYHRSRDGWMLIAEMENGHLERAISYFLRKLDDAKRTIEGNVSKFESALYGIKHDIAGAEEMLQECTVKLAGLFYEAVIRGIDVTAARATLVNILGREEAVVVPGKLGRMALDYYDAIEEENES